MFIVLQRQALNQYTKKPHQYNYNYFQENCKNYITITAGKNLTNTITNTITITIWPQNSVNLENLAKFGEN